MATLSSATEPSEYARIVPVARSDGKAQPSSDGGIIAVFTRAVERAYLVHDVVSTDCYRRRFLSHTDVR